MIDLHPGQSDVLDAIALSDLCRFGVVDCSRGWGKSHLGATAAIGAVWELLELPRSVPNKDVYIIAPTYDQVMDIYYPLLNYDLGLENYTIKKASKDDGIFEFENRTKLRLLSYEAVERMRGKGAYFVVWDEVSSCKKGIKPKDAWESVIKPCIVTRWSRAKQKMYRARHPGRALMIGTPKGFNYFYDMYNFRETDPEWRSWMYDYMSSPLLDPAEIEKERELMDPIKFASEYLASFKESGNNVFYCFDRSKHVKNDIEYFRPKRDDEEHGEDVHVTIDFNVGLQCSAAFGVRGEKQTVEFIEDFKGHPDTLELARMFKAKYVDKGHRVFTYPDPSGKARKTSAPVGTTDFSILEAHGLRVMARNAAPPIIDSVQAVNRKLINANYHIGMYVSSNCKGLIPSLERTKWVDNNPDLALIDKSEGVEHFSDGVRYGMEYLFPIRRGGSVIRDSDSF